MNGTDDEEPTPRPRPSSWGDPPLITAALVLVVTILIVLVLYLTYKLCWRETKAGTDHKSRLSKHVSKSVAVIVKLPSLVESVAPTVDFVVERPFNSLSKSKKVLRPNESKSLKICEWNTADVKAKISFTAGG